MRCYSGQSKCIRTFGRLSSRRGVPPLEFKATEPWRRAALRATCDGQLDHSRPCEVTVVRPFRPHFRCCGDHVRIERVSGANDRRCSARSPILRDLHFGTTAHGAVSISSPLRGSPGRGTGGADTGLVGEMTRRWADVRDDSIEFLVRVVRRLIDRHDFRHASTGVPITQGHAHVQLALLPPSLNVSEAADAACSGRVDASADSPGPRDHQLAPFHIPHCESCGRVAPDGIEVLVNMLQQATRDGPSRNERIATGGSDR